MASTASFSRAYRGMALAFAITVAPLSGIVAGPVSGKGGITGIGSAVARAQDATIPVPAGQTTTVSLPVPVDVNVASDGWNVSASGGTATVTAPAAGGQISVPVTYQGVTMTIVLVADAEVTAEELNDAAESGDPDSLGGGQQNPGGADGLGDNGDPQGGTGGDEKEGGNDPATGGSAPATDGGGKGQARPPRTGRGWEGVDDSHAAYVNLESTIDGQTITAKLGFKQALDLYNRFKHLEDDGVTLRYLNAEGEFVEGVKREIDKGSRTMTLTYPEGTEPDNPFIMQFFNKDTQSAELVVTLTDPTRENAGEVPPEQQLDSDGANESDSEDQNSSKVGAGALAAGIVGIGIIALIVGFIVKRRRSTSKEELS
ncbi:hypothetical protein [Corynebacterium sp. HMSC069E04]|uniref:hypothetical protein n=1 Tax=Corynebacterium sp. HMSC069E04 TaxID=1739400 RepID=UPI0008A4DDA1|nr:hypothetical protein [Corynebacterium sp. HMSC069E04]OFS39672.1 hypothetical protein HMPREF2896_05315 [Corynebacterium sp. HMSC069E04]